MRWRRTRRLCSINLNLFVRVSNLVCSTMYRLVNIVTAVLGFAVFCGLHSYGSASLVQPIFFDIKGLQVTKNDQESAFAPLVTKERQKRATNQPTPLPASEEEKQMKEHELFVESLKSDPGFLANIEIVFGSVSVRNTTNHNYKTNGSVADESSDKNNTGIDDRLQSRNFFHKRYKEFLITEKIPTTPPTSNSHGSHLPTPVKPSYNISSDTVFGTPSFLTAEDKPHETKADDGYTSDDFTTESILTSQKSSSTKKTIFYVNFIYFLIFVFLLS